MLAAGIQFKKVYLNYDFTFDLKELADIDVLITPYWISRDLFTIPFDDVKKVYPSIKIITYTGTSPYWEGCGWVNFDPKTKDIKLGSNGTQDTAKNLNAIDVFATVWSEDPSNREQVVGMGVHEELTYQKPKTPMPFVILDYFKPNWDEKVFELAVKGLILAKEKRPDITPIIFGQSTVQRAIDISPEASSWALATQDTYVEFEIIQEFYSQSWAMLTHNESFGFPIHEAGASGVKVFSHLFSELPSFAREFIQPWTSAQNLADLLVGFFNGYTDETPSLVYGSWEDMARKNLLLSWVETAERLNNLAKNLCEARAE